MGSKGGERRRLEISEFDPVVEELSKYIKLFGMFTAIKINSTEPMAYNGINENQYEWKEYEPSSPYLNSHKYSEIKFNISDSTLKGTYKSVDKMPYVINDY